MHAWWDPALVEKEMHARAIIDLHSHVMFMTKATDVTVPFPVGAEDLSPFSIEFLHEIYKTRFFIKINKEMCCWVCNDLGLTQF